MKHLRLNSLFHWLYAFLMLYPILCFFGTWLVLAFNSNFNFDSQDFSSIASNFFNVLDGSILLFDTGSVGANIENVYSYLLTNLFGPEISNLGASLPSLLTHWTIVSVLYLVFDVLMIPVNFCHRLIDEGGF